MRPRTAISLLASIAGVTACAGEAPAPVIKPAPVEQPPVAFVSPARWDYHPGPPSGATALVTLDDGGCLFTTGDGQRWRTAPPSASKKASAPCSGAAEIAASIAPQALVAILKRASGWTFAGADGTLYDAPEPTAAFSRTTLPPEPIVRVSGGGAGLVGVTREGKLLRWDDASGFKPASVPKAPAPSSPSSSKRARALEAPEPRFIDVAAASKGPRALALALPEALFTSDDGGATWARANVKPIGAHRLGRSKDDKLMAEGLIESAIVGDGSPPPITFAKDAAPSFPKVDVEAGRAASALALSTGGAAADGDRYVELVKPESEGNDWTLARGRIEGRLTTSPFVGSADCSSFRVGMRGREVFVVCIAGGSSSWVKRSADGGDTWSAPLKLAQSGDAQVAVAVAPDGSALITGVCKPSDGASCKPAAPLLVRSPAPRGLIRGAEAADDAGPKEDLVARGAAVPQLAGVAVAPAFSLDGKSAYFLGRRGKDERISLFVSHDAGDSFAERPLIAPRAPEPKPRRTDPDDDEEPEPSEGPDTFEIDELSAIRVGDDGALGITLAKGRGGTAYVIADDDGRMLDVVSPPHEDATIAGIGRRIIAIVAAADSHAPAQIWESLDGGGTWDAQAAPSALTQETRGGMGPIACAIGGCLVGDTLARVGWGGQGEAPALPPPPDPPPQPQPSVLTPIACEFTQGSKWIRVEDVYSGLTTLPDLNAIMRRRSLWSTLTLSHETGAVSAISADIPEAGEGDARVAPKSLLPGHKRPQRFATLVSRQAEGYAAIRVPLPIEHGALKPSSPMRNVEVAWENYMTGASGRGRIADAGAFDPADVHLGDFDAIQMSLVSVSVGGIVVAVHRNPLKTKAFFISTAGRAEPVEMPVWPKVDLQPDTAIVDGKVLGVGLVRGPMGAGIGVVLGRKAGSAWEHNALALAPTSGRPGLLIETDWSYLDKTALGFTTLFMEQGRAHGYYAGLNADGTFAPPIALPTLSDVPDRPRPCAADDRASTPRVESRFFASYNNEVLFPGKRHPVLVREPAQGKAAPSGDPIVLLTAGAVLYGTPSSPCLGAFEGYGVQRAAVSAVIAGDLKRAFLFRIGSAETARPGRRSSSQSFEHRAMTCRFDPNARVPESVWAERGTVISARVK